MRHATYVVANTDACSTLQRGASGHGLVEGDTASLPVPRGVDGR
jgi:hypothetical protein